MKNLVKTLFTFALLGLLIPNTISAQSLSKSCYYSPIVDASCVGACGNTGIMNYNGLSSSLSLSATDNFCVTTESSSLCPTHNSKTAIYVNGALIATYNSTAAGTTYSFSAQQGSVVKVITGLVAVPSKVVCVWLGEVNLSLRKAP